jgi:hypothetical protein
MDMGRDSVMATGLRLVIVAGCIAAMAVLLAGPGGALSGPPSVGRGLVPAGIDRAILAAMIVAGAGVATVAVRGSASVGWLAIGLGAALIAASAVGAGHVPTLVPPIASAAAAVVPIVLCAEAVALDASPNRWNGGRTEAAWMRAGPASRTFS